jgi:hypothetical protein
VSSFEIDSSKFPKGTGKLVTNLNGWHGRIAPRPERWHWEASGSISLVYVHWKEREQHENPLVRKEPVISALPENLIYLD